MITLAGGNTSKKFADCDICIASQPLLQSSQEKAKIVTPKWLFESLHHYKLQEHSQFEVKEEEIDTDTSSVTTHKKTLSPMKNPSSQSKYFKHGSSPTIVSIKKNSKLFKRN